jgi:hypothetical protein
VGADGGLLGGAALRRHLAGDHDGGRRLPYREGVIGSGKVAGVSTPFPPRAYCAWEDGTVHELTPGAEFLFWVFFALAVVPLGAGLWHALRDPRSLLR